MFCCAGRSFQAIIGRQKHHEREIAGVARRERGKAETRPARTGTDVMTDSCKPELWDHETNEPIRLNLGVKYVTVYSLVRSMCWH
jgi:hypothetical protein